MKWEVAEFKDRYYYCRRVLDEFVIASKNSDKETIKRIIKEHDELIEREKESIKNLIEGVLG